jgi:predicted metal-dependent hydrolase
MTTVDARTGLPAEPGATPGAPPRVRDARVVDPRGRSKVFRPLPPVEREAAVARGLDAYARGAFYLAHEELEPAWMAADDPGERELLGGLIKLAAAHVHAARGNPAGVATNLRGARARLAGARSTANDRGLDLPALLASIDDRLAAVAAMRATNAAPRGALPDPPHDVAGPPGRARRPPLDLDPLPLPRKTTT